MGIDGCTKSVLAFDAPATYGAAIDLPASDMPAIDLPASDGHVGSMTVFGRRGRN